MRNEKIIFLFLNQNIHCVYSSEPGYFEHPKHMQKLMDKKIFTILCSRFLLFKLAKMTCLAMAAICSVALECIPTFGV